MCIYTHMHICVYRHIHIDTQYTYICACIHAYMYINIYTHMHAFMHTYIQSMA